MPSAKFAISYTVKNESRLLPSAIKYHIAAGCSRIYMFWDGTTDGSESLVSEFPNVVARNSIKPDEIDDPPAWIARVVSCWELIMDVRKNINTFYAAKEAAIAILNPARIARLKKKKILLEIDAVSNRMREFREESASRPLQ